MLLKLLTLAPLASAHFLLKWPVARGFDDDKAPTFPCGGFDTVSSNRTQFPLSGGPVQLDMEHTQTNLQVFLALGNGDGSYSIQLVPTFLETGPNNFCMGDVTFPSDLNLKEGDNATLQVVSNGDPDGGLYQCADITFTSTPLTDAEFKQNCVNSTGITVGPTTLKGDANGTIPNGASSSASGTASATGSNSAAGSPTSSKSSGLAPQATVAGWALGAMGVVGMVAAL